MPIDVTKFVGVLPYASELFGIYQPLIGWRSERIKIRYLNEQAKTVSALVKSMAHDSRVRGAVGADGLPKGPDADLPRITPSWLARPIAAQFQNGLQGFQRAHGRAPRGAEWDSLLRGLKLDKTVKVLTASLAKTGRPIDDSDLTILNTKSRSEQQLRALGAVRISGTDLAVARTARSSKKSSGPIGPSPAMQAAVQVGALKYLAANNSNVLDALLASKSLWEHLLAWLDPLAQFDPDTQDAVLSPIGVMNIFRQYFFEFDSFLGPPIGHVWVSPGGGVEIYEVHTRKTVEQRTMELRTQAISRLEKELSTEDELATKVSKENSSNISAGVTVSAGANVGVFQASASANFSYQSSQKSSQETAHEHSRKQTEKISNEMRRDFKTTFRTSVETQDTSSRRYTLSNTTDTLVNYEFRRKMRQVGVQVQHIGTQLCWQTWVDQPGTRIAISELVHIAKRGDLTGQLQPPEAPPVLEPIQQDFEAVFPFMGDSSEMGEEYIEGKEGMPDFLFFDLDEDGIRSAMTFDVVPPATGYKLDAAIHQRDVRGNNPDEDPPSPIAADFEWVSDTSFKIRLRQVNFNENSAIIFLLTLTYVPTKATLDAVKLAYEAKLKEYEQKKARAAHDEYVREVRDRIKVASKIEKRPSSELRGEERSAIYEYLMEDLRPGAGDEKQHVTVELIRAIFDIDRMLYFVAENWWMPRMRYAQQFYQGTNESLTNQDAVGWSGPGSVMRKWIGVDNYLITEESEPAPAGASLGWLLQLDGDEHRNAFLNSPFVKAVIPIRPGKETAAIEWLERGHVEGADGLDTPYRGTEPEFKGKTIRQVLNALASKLRSENTKVENVLATETVYEKGFDPLPGGFVAAGKPYEVFDQWIEVLPTEQVVAVEYKTES